MCWSNPFSLHKPTRLSSPKVWLQLIIILAFRWLKFEFKLLTALFTFHGFWLDDCDITWSSRHLIGWSHLWMSQMFAKCKYFGCYMKKYIEIFFLFIFIFRENMLRLSLRCRLRRQLRSRLSNNTQRWWLCNCIQEVQLGTAQEPKWSQWSQRQLLDLSIRWKQKQVRLVVRSLFLLKSE